MSVICKAGNRRGLVCQHKRNVGGTIVVCAINATKEVCIDAGDDISNEELEKIRGILGK